ncbi:glycerol kinase GlpK [Ignavigranum ruoffiae]|uniref:glycerol kinase GlpK n=1 Tax=Ignavigranum ruoffiae TaxID=89093 RepID=UPI00206E700A|nr:glycerol kinase GlpK [Ignavigranum ruoffiae]UPQ85570.1 glycerol kinase GlpK [Ignavigranum ruoffiae]
MEQYILTLDQGTTSSRALIINHQGQVMGMGQVEFPQYFPQEGWVEHDAEEIWQSIQAVIAEAFIHSSILPQQIAAIGITNQRETTVVWNRQTGKPVYPAIVWQSRQTAKLCQQYIDQGYQPMIQAKTGLIMDAYFSATKIRWILDHIQDGQQRAEAGELCFGTIDSWLLWKLTAGQVHATDYTNASRTLLFNIETGQWDPDLLDLFGIPAVMLPEVRSNSEIYGYTDSFQFFGQPVPITAMIGDQQAALFGQLAFEPGMIKATYGTGAFIMMNMGQKAKISQNQLLTTIAYALDDQIYYAMEGSIFTAGSAIQWLRDQLNLFEQAKESQAMAEAAQKEEAIYLVPAFTGLAAPYWDSQVRGAIFGLNRASNKNDLVKATLQSIAYQVKDIVDLMQEESQLDIPVLKVDGGACLNDYLMQFQADLLDIEIQRVHNLETTALGAAYLAGLAVGFWQNLDQLKDLIDPGKTFQSQMPRAKAQQLYQGWQKAVRAAQLFANSSDSLS